MRGSILHDGAKCVMRKDKFIFSPFMLIRDGKVTYPVSGRILGDECAPTGRGVEW